MTTSVDVVYKVEVEVGVDESDHAETGWDALLSASVQFFIRTVQTFALQTYNSLLPKPGLLGMLPMPAHR